MKRNSGKLAAIAIAAAALAPATAAAMPIKDGSGVHRTAMTCGKDYSRNSVDGNYCIRSVPTSAPVPVTQPPAQVTVGHQGFVWGDAFAGAGAALAIVVTGAGAAGLRRRRRGIGQGQLAG